MNCQNLREKLHDFLDEELACTEMAAFERHLEHCAQCRRLRDEVGLIQEALYIESRLSTVAEEQLWHRIQTRLPRSVKTRLREVWKRGSAFWQDLDRRIVWSKLMALPVACGLFALILLDFSTLPMEKVTYPVLNLLPPPSSGFEQLVVTPLTVRQNGAQINGLMSTAWKMPYEDSLSLLVEITPEGHAEIDDILEYPKNRELLHAVGLTLRRAQFESAPELIEPFVIYSFQKIDVYGDQKGM